MGLLQMLTERRAERNARKALEASRTATDRFRVAELTSTPIGSYEDLRVQVKQALAGHVANPQSTMMELCEDPAVLRIAELGIGLTMGLRGISQYGRDNHFIADIQDLAQHLQSTQDPAPPCTACEVRNTAEMVRVYDRMPEQLRDAFVDTAVAAACCKAKIENEIRTKYMRK